MANTQAQFGFRPLGSVLAVTPSYGQRTYAISKTNASAIGYGDPVVRVSGSSPYIQQATTAGATAAPIVGVFVGCQYTPVGGLGIPQWSTFWPGVTAVSDAVAYVIDSPDSTFLVATISTAVTSSNIGQVVNFTTGAPQTTGGGFSIATIDQGTATSNQGTAISSFPFKIVGIYGQGAYGGVGNGTDPTTPFNWAVVTFNNQAFRALVGN